MVEETAFLTAEGYEKLQTELEYLKTVRRREVAENIRDAKEGGDISENAGYEQAKEEQAFVEGRIMTLEGILRAAAIIFRPVSFRKTHPRTSEVLFERYWT